MSDDLEPKTYEGHNAELENALKGIAESLAHIEFKILRLAIMSIHHDEMLLNKTGIKAVSLEDIYAKKKTVKII